MTVSGCQNFWPQRPRAHQTVRFPYSLVHMNPEQLSALHRGYSIELSFSVPDDPDDDFFGKEMWCYDIFKDGIHILDSEVVFGSEEQALADALSFLNETGRENPAN